MRIITQPLEMQKVALENRLQNKTIGLVPTMGALHEGHLSLIRKAREVADTVVVSIFVNPVQFGPGEDFNKYPRAFDRDVELCRGAAADIIFSPQSADIYSAAHSVYIDESLLSAGLCGASRPGHFRGVLTVVGKLFNITLPHKAVFGQKDAQQAILINKMVRDLNFPVEIIIAPIVRESDGLAMSSRNIYLSPDERVRALCLHRALGKALEMYNHGERRAVGVKAAMEEIVSFAGGIIDYIACVDCAGLQPVDEIGENTLIAMAVYIGKTRLIDNAVISSE